MWIHDLLGHRQREPHMQYSGSPILLCLTNLFNVCALVIMFLVATKAISSTAHVAGSTRAHIVLGLNLGPHV